MVTVVPDGFLWRRVFEVDVPFFARLTVYFPENGRLAILNAASPVSARLTRLFVPIARNFDKDLPLDDVYAFTALALVESALRVEGAGAMSPAQAFDSARMLEALRGPLLSWQPPAA